MSPTTIATIVYTSAFLPLLVLIVLSLLNKLPKWVWKIYLLTFIICAFGWEIWFTYGLVDGQSVNIRRPDALNALIPQNINWFVNSLADAGIGVNGLFYVWLFSSLRSSILDKWSWKEVIILASFFLLQNLVVELYIYQAQLAAGYQLSWAPLAPIGPWWNPVLFSIAGKSVHLHTQLPWLIMTPLFYWYARKLKKGDMSTKGK